MGLIQIMAKTNFKLELTKEEKARIRAARLRIADLARLGIAEMAGLLNVPNTTAKEIAALIAFQAVPSIGVKFAQDLISIGYHSLADLKHKDGPTLINELEAHCGYWIDPCVEDQCRLVVHYANNGDESKNWWDFTAERKAYRAEYGYPASRPTKPWFELYGYNKG